MYIVAIAWIYVVLMMSVTENSVVAALMTFILYGFLPVMLILYLMGTSQRKRNRLKKAQSPVPADGPAAPQNTPLPTDESSPPAP